MENNLLIETMLLDYDQCLIESKDNGIMVLEGPFQRSDVKNANGRVYPRKIWETVLKDGAPAQKKVSERGMVGHLEHPKDGVTDMNLVSHVVTALRLNESGEVVGKIEILDTDAGKKAQEFVRKKIRLGISSRGAGTVDPQGSVREDYQLDTFDLVHRPSTIDAFPKPVQPAVRNEAVQDKTPETPIKNITDIQEDIMDAVITIFKAKEVLANSLLEQDISALLPFQSEDLSSKLLECSIEVARLGKQDQAISSAADALSERLLEKREELREQKKDEKDAKNGKKFPPKKADDKKDEEEDKDEEETKDDARDESAREIDAMRRLLEKAREEILQTREEIENVKKENEALYQLSEGLVEKSKEQLDEMAKTSVPMAQVEEKISDLQGRYDAACLLLQEMSSAEGEIEEAVEEAIQANPGLEKVRDLFESCQTVESVNKLAQSVLSVAGTKPAPSVKSPELKKFPFGLMVESADAGEKPAAKQQIDESASKSVQILQKLKIQNRIN